MTKKVDRIGQRFTHCVVIREFGRNKKGNVAWECLCDCGKVFTSLGYDLSIGKVKSGKCLPKAQTHGHGGRGKNRNKMYSIWAAMVQRCERLWRETPREKEEKGLNTQTPETKVLINSK